jgi:hypothetical protein
MNLTTLSLLANVVHGVPSGNYNGTSLEFAGNAQPAADYYAGQGNMQTVNISTTDFIGNVTLQASLNPVSNTAIWFDVEKYVCNTATSSTQSYSLIGNFVWMRAKISDFTQGNIGNITLVY